MGKKKHKCVCHECQVDFDLTIVGDNTRLVPDICPFCGDCVDFRDERPILKDFDDYDKFDDAEYLSDEDDIDDD
jgi:hypothetical protein